MNLEELKKILENADMSAEDKQKAIIDLHEAETKGLLQKRDELLASEKKLKDEKTALEAKVTTSTSKMSELEAELKKNNPESTQKYYDAKLQELETKHKSDMETVSTERDKFRQSHYDRIRIDAVTEGIKDLKIIPQYKDAYIALVMSKNNFKVTEINGKTEFLNDANKTIDAVLREFSHTDEGKAFIENPNSGGGAGGGQPGAGGANTGGSGQSVTREQFGGMSPAAQVDFVNKGGKVTN
jgi:chromosome segregation ATPase